MPSLILPVFLFAIAAASPASAEPCEQREIVDTLNQYGRLPVAMSWIALGMETRACLNCVERAAKLDAAEHPERAAPHPAPLPSGYWMRGDAEGRVQVADAKFDINKLLDAGIAG